MKSFNHEEREGLEDHEEDPFSPKRMRNASPLSQKLSELCTRRLGARLPFIGRLGLAFWSPFTGRRCPLSLKAGRLLTSVSARSMLLIAGSQSLDSESI